MTSFLFWTCVAAACATVYYNFSGGRTRVSSSGSSRKIGSHSGV